MKTFTSFEIYLRSIRNLPEVRTLLDGNSLTTVLLETAFSKAAAAAFENWYEARTYCCLAPVGVINGYPGDKAAFSLALKAAFFPYRYAWPKLDLDKALEAVARSLPAVEVLDGYPELAHLVRAMEKRKAMRDSFVADNPEGDTIQRIMDENPQAQKMLRILRTLQAREAQVPEGASGVDSDTGTPCDCPSCTALRERASFEVAPAADDLTKATSPLGEGLKQLGEGLKQLENAPPGFRERLETLRQLLRQREERRQPENPLQQLTIEANALRMALAKGRLDDAVSQSLDVMPDAFKEANIQVGLTLIQELGYGDVVEPYVAAVRKHGRFPDFTALPLQGSVAEATYNDLLGKIRETLKD